MRQSVRKTDRTGEAKAEGKAGTGGAKAAKWMTGQQRHPCTRMRAAERLRYAAGDVGLIFLIGELFYHSLPGAVVLLPGAVWLLKEQQEELCRKKEREMQRQFLDAIQIMAASLQSGYSVENAVRAAAGELEKLYQAETFIVSEFQNLQAQLDVNRSVEELLLELGERSRIEDIQSFAEVFLTAKRTGGDLLYVIRNTASSIRQKQETLSEIETVLTGKMMEQKVMSLMPLLILLYVRLTSPEFLSGMYGNLTGCAVMTGCLLVYVIAWLWGKKIVRIEV